MSDPSGHKIVKRSFEADVNKIRISDERWILDIDASVPDPLTLSELTVTTLHLLEPGGPSSITLLAPSLAGDLTFTLPDNDGDPGDVLTTDGDGNLTWEPASSSGAPANATYIVVSLDATLTDERRLQAENTVLLLTDGGAGGDLTISVVTNGITDAKLRQSAGVSVVGRSANTTGNVADIVAGANDRVLSRASDALAFTQVSTGMVADDAITDAKLRDSGACSVIGRSANSSGSPADISAAANGTVLVRAANALAFSDAVHVQTLVLDDDDASAGITVQAPSAITSWTLTLPSDDGAANEVLSTDGSGVTDWVTVDSVLVGRRDIYAWRHAGTTGFEAWYTPSIHSEANIAATIQSNVLMATPFVVADTMTIDRIAIHKNAAGASGARGTVGIYNATSRSNFYPNALVLSVELDLDADTGAGAAVVPSTISQQLTPGLYWFAWNQDNSPSPPQLFAHDVSPSSISSILGVNPATFATPYRSLRVAQTYDSAAMPDPFPGGAALDGTQQMPTIAVRVASYP